MSKGRNPSVEFNQLSHPLSRKRSCSVEPTSGSERGLSGAFRFHHLSRFGKRSAINAALHLNRTTAPRSRLEFDDPAPIFAGDVEWTSQNRRPGI